MTDNTRSKRETLLNLGYEKVPPNGVPFWASGKLINKLSLMEAVWNVSFA